MLSGFKVIDLTTKAEVDRAAVSKEPWLVRLVTMGGRKLSFALDEDGLLMAVDACGSYVYCPASRFFARGEYT